MYGQKKTLLFLPFGELIAHADLVWDFLIVNLTVSQSILDAVTIPYRRVFFSLGIMFHIPLYLELNGILSLSSKHGS